MTLQLAIGHRFRQSCCYLDEHSVLEGMRDLVTRKGDVWVPMQLPAAMCGAVTCQPAAKRLVTSAGRHMPRAVRRDQPIWTADGVNHIVCKQAWPGHAQTYPVKRLTF